MVKESQKLSAVACKCSFPIIQIKYQTILPIVVTHNFFSNAVYTTLFIRYVYSFIKSIGQFIVEQVSLS